MILIKMGGSIITNKKKALSPRKKATDALARALGKIGEPLVVVHGGGSFGHYWSVRYGMHTKPARYDPRGVSVVKDSMVELDKMVLRALLGAKLNPYPMPPATFVRGQRKVTSAIKEMNGMMRAGMVPVTYGDAVWCGRGRSYILSGDSIMSMLARVLRPRLSIFALDADGVYSDPDTKQIVEELGARTPRLTGGGMDVTGGMKRKIDEGRRIARMGLDVFFVNGNKPARIIGATKGRFKGTLLRGR